MFIYLLVRMLFFTAVYINNLSSADLKCGQRVSVFSSLVTPEALIQPFHIRIVPDYSWADTQISPPPLMNDAWRQFKLRHLESYQTFRRDLKIMYKNCETTSLTTIKERSLRVYGIRGEYWDQ